MSRYWCKQCELFIDDNNISKRNHNESQKHLKNVQRSIQKLHQKNRDEAKEKGINLNYVKKTTKKEDSTTEKEAKGEVIPEIGAWETVEETVEQPISQEPKETLVDHTKTHLHEIIPKKQSLKITTHSETKKWNITKKKQPINSLSDSDDDNDNDKATPKPTIAFKKRKVQKK